MKKMILSTAALLTIVSLAACSNKQDTKKKLQIVNQLLK